MSLNQSEQSGSLFYTLPIGHSVMIDSVVVLDTTLTLQMLFIKK